MLKDSWPYVAITLILVSFYFAFQAVKTSRTSQGAVGWVIFILAAPYIAVFVYPFLGRWRYRGYVVAHREQRELIDSIREHARQYAPHIDAKSRGYQALETIAFTPILRGNDVELLIDGGMAFDTMFRDMQQAQRYVLAQFYIVKDDELGKRFADALIACADRGLDVRLLYDAVGSHALSPRYVARLEAAGVKVAISQSLGSLLSRFQINFRNHRKLLICDGEIGFTGGLNVGDEYLGLCDKFGHWRDTHCRLKGPVVSELQLIFAEDWQWASGSERFEQLTWQVEPIVDGMDAMVMATGPADRIESGSLYFCEVINSAKVRLWIASPYFVPDNDILSALKLAAMRDVEVRILVPDQIDHNMPWLAAYAYFDELREVGIEIWRYVGGFMHQKVVLVDDAYASVGSTNLDNRSCRLNFELTALIFDRRLAKAVETMLHDDFESAFRLDKALADQPWAIRHGAPIAKLFAPLL
ncbi:cardiolipin synthase [Gammaproteobacteria bacterium]|nr:cardiolipin synthase [Gammaproteobacteria bacterium]